jgi:hypothetical protein
MTNIKLSAFVILLFLLAAVGISAQGIGSYGNTYIHQGAEIGLHGKLVFYNNGAGANHGVMMTNRSSINPGVVAFGDNATWESAADDRHIDGYVRAYSNESFTFPIGNLGKFQPITISGATGTTAAYFYDNVAKLPFIDNAVSTRSSAVSEMNLRVSEEEYWDLRGDKPTKVTLHWDHDSAIEQLSNGELENLAIVGWNGSTWEVLSSSVDQNVVDVTTSIGSFSDDESSFAAGSITTNDEIVPDDYSVITFGALTSEDAESIDTEFGSELASDETIELTLFPNPTTDLGNLNIDYDITQTNSDATLVVLNSQGELIYSLVLKNEKEIINLSHQESTAGMYHIGIYTKNGSKVFKPVVVTNN